MDTKNSKLEGEDLHQELEHARDALFDTLRAEKLVGVILQKNNPGLCHGWTIRVWFKGKPVGLSLELAATEGGTVQTYYRLVGIDGKLAHNEELGYKRYCPLRRDGTKDVLAEVIRVQKFYVG